VKRTLPFVLVPLALLAAGCTTKYIGDTKIEDNAENRAVLRVLEQYRRAVEDKDVQRVLELTSDHYFEDPGTPHEPRDDYDKRGLEERLEEAFGHVADQSLQIDARKIEMADDEKTASVEYVFDYRFRLVLPGGAKDDWRKEMDVNRVKLVREGKDWKFISGL
jgi:hypothetical protein